MKTDVHASAMALIEFRVKSNERISQSHQSTHRAPASCEAYASNIQEQYAAPSLEESLFFGRKGIPVCGDFTRVRGVAKKSAVGSTAKSVKHNTAGQPPGPELSLEERRTVPKAPRIHRNGELAQNLARGNAADRRRGNSSVTQAELSQEIVYEYLNKVYAVCFSEIIELTRVESAEKAEVLKLICDNVLNLSIWLDKYYRNRLATETHKHAIKCEEDSRRYLFQIQELQDELAQQSKDKTKKDGYFY